MTAATAASIAGAAATVGGAIMQSSAAGDAADTLAGGNEQAGALYASNQATNDGLLDQAGQWGIKQYSPWDTLGRQGTQALSRYLGFMPEYTRAKPKKPTANSARGLADFYGRNSGRPAAYNDKLAGPLKKKLARQDKKAAKTYKNELAAWKDGRTEFRANQKGKSDWNDYNRPYTREMLMADPIYQTELAENVRAWDTSAASRGSLMSGNTVAGLRELTAAGIERGYGRDWNQRERKFNALAGVSNTGLGVQNARVGLNTGTAQGRVQNNQWATSGTAGAQIGAADARASGQLSQGTAYGNAFGSIGQMGMLYGAGAFATPSYASDPGGKVGPWY